MKRTVLIAAFAGIFFSAFCQERMTPELLWKLGRVTPVGITKDSSGVVFTVSTPDMEANKSSRKTYMIPLTGGPATEISDSNEYVRNDHISPNGKYKIVADDVKMKNVFGKDFYPDATKSTAQIYDQLAYRHWDEWEDGAFSHIFFSPLANQAKEKIS